MDMKNLLNNVVTNIKGLPKITWVIVLIAFFLGFMFSGDGNTVDKTMSKGDPTTEVTTWTCSMHPSVKLPEFGQCPICFMDLIPLESGSSDSGPGELSLSENAIKISEILTQKVKRGKAEAQVMLSGKVEYDETRIKKITAWVQGRLEHLYVDYTGISVKKGDHLVEIYSPALYSSQEELIQAINQVNNGSSDLVKESAKLNLSAAREKLSLLGLTEGQIAEIEKSKKPNDLLTIYSPISGIVIHKNAVVGNYVNTGSQIYTIADLTRVWVVLDAYESDLSLLRFGQNVRFTTEALPGQEFEGRISFIDPILNEKTRTVKVRINIENLDGKLKPGMFVRATVSAELDGAGKPYTRDLAGKWISPMHPEIIKDGPGSCDVCGMDLVPAENLGIVNLSGEKAPLMIPATAVLKTGKRAIVYIKKPGTKDHLFVLREIELGPRAGDNYVVLGGLEEGEEVVIKGNFKIDSAMQIAANYSMMNPEEVEESDMNFNVSEEYLKNIEPLFNSYFKLQSGLASDNLSESRSSFITLKKTLNNLNNSKLNLDNEEYEIFEGFKSTTMELVSHLDHWNNLDDLRLAFEKLSLSLLDLEQKLGHGNNQYYEVFCPMAFNDKGASWLQTDDKVLNPYFGATMLTCGVVKNELKPAVLKGSSYE